MNQAKYYVLAYKTKADRKAGDYEYSFDCTTLAQAYLRRRVEQIYEEHGEA